MKSFTLLIVLFAAFFATSCSSSDAPEINSFRVESAMASTIATPVSSNTVAPTMRVSFVGSCVTIASTDELLNMVMATTEGEVTLTNLGKRSGMFCSPNNADITAVWVSTVDKHVSRHDNKASKAKNTIAQR